MAFSIFDNTSWTLGGKYAQSETNKIETKYIVSPTDEITKLKQVQYVTSSPSERINSYLQIGLLVVGAYFAYKAIKK